MVSPSDAMLGSCVVGCSVEFVAAMTVVGSVEILSRGKGTTVKYYPLI